MHPAPFFPTTNQTPPISSSLTSFNANQHHHHHPLTHPRGPTVPSTPLSEARSYANLAAANAYWGLLPDTSTTTTTSITTTTSPHHHHPRIELEERALDSYQNILFSIIQFWRRTGYSDWPTHLTIVSHAFKRRRLVSAHCAALGFVDGDRHTQPRRGVTFVGINPPGVPEVVENEEKAVEAWVHDPQGQSSGLRGKRRGRNPWKVSQTLFLDEAERERSGLHTRLVENEDVREDILVDGVARPWEQ